MTNNSRWMHRPEGSNWGDFGPDDELGRLNLIDSAAVLRGAREIREGLSFCLSLPLDLPGGSALNPRRHPPQLAPTSRDGHPVFNLPIADVDAAQAHCTDVLCDDSVHLHTQYSTQWDSFAHVGHRFDADGDGVAERVYYNGWRADEHIIGPDDPQGRPFGAHRLGIENFAVKAIQTRGVLVDFATTYGERNHFVGHAELTTLMASQGVSMMPGDILCLYTGYADLLVEMKGQPDMGRLHRACAVLDGSDPKLRNWIAASGVAAIVADNHAVEGLPPLALGGHCRLPLHELCLFKLGIPLGELWHLGPLAQVLRKRARSHFMLTAPPLRLPRAVGSPVTPVATI